MKRGILFFAYLLILITLISFVYADIPPGPDYHYVTGCSKIVNLD
jgi:hypothetical protein